MRTIQVLFITWNWLRVRDCHQIPINLKLPYRTRRNLYKEEEEEEEEAEKRIEQIRGGGSPYFCLYRYNVLSSDPSWVSGVVRDSSINYNVRKESPRSGHMLTLVFGVYHRDSSVPLPGLLSVVSVGLADLLMSAAWVNAGHVAVAQALSEDQGIMNG